MATRTPTQSKSARTSKGESAKKVAIDILATAGKPLHAKEIAKRVIDSGRCAGLKGKTPEATITAMLAVGSKPGGPFTRIDKGTYTLAADASTEGEQPQPPAAAKAPRTRKPPRTKTTAENTTARHKETPPL